MSINRSTIYIKKSINSNKSILISKRCAPSTVNLQKTLKEHAARHKELIIEKENDELVNRLYEKSLQILQKIASNKKGTKGLQYCPTIRRSLKDVVNW